MNDSPVIRRMEREDVSRIFHIQQELAFQAWTETQMSEEVSLSCSLPLAALIRGEIAGYAFFHLLADEAELLSIAVAPIWQRHGIARNLWEKGFGELVSRGARTLFLEVRAGNTGAQAFYRKLGCTEMHRRRSYYADGEDAVIMQKRIKR